MKALVLKNQSSQRLLIGVFYLGLIGLVLFSYFEFRRRRESAVTASNTLELCRNLAHEINSLRNRPLFAALNVRSESELARRIDERKKKLGLPERSISRIQPQSPQRIGETEYKRQTTSLELQGVTLRDLTLLLTSLVKDDPELQITSLRLIAPRNSKEASAELWRVEVTLTYLIFSPKIHSSGALSLVVHGRIYASPPIDLFLSDPLRWMCFIPS